MGSSGNVMYRHVLIGVDGSPVALKAALHGFNLAKSISAMATAIIVTPTWEAIALSEIVQGHFQDEYDARTEKYAERSLGKVRSIAMERRVACETIHVTAARPFEAILSTAAHNGCDLIIVGSHGRQGTERLLLGSETVKLLTHSKVPVLVYREK